MTSLAKEEREKAREAKELAHWKKEKARPKSKAYFWYLMLVLTLIYIIDEVTTNSVTQVEDGLIASFFPNTDLQTAEGYINLLSTAAIALMILSCFYKPLADRYGRKIFLFINTLGMAGAMFVCFLAPNFWVYALGFCLMRWFVTPDEQVVYIVEVAPKKLRGTLNSLVKGIAEFGLFLIPWFRKMFMTDTGDIGGWKWVFLVIAIIGFVFALLALLLARESDAFLDERIAYLSLSDEEKKALAAQKLNNKKKQGGLLTAIVYAFKDRQLRWIFICTTLYTIGRVVTDRNTAIMAATWGENSPLITDAQFILPVGAGIVTIIAGFLSDWVGRKKASIILLSSCTVFFVLFVLGIQYGWSAYLVGSFLGLYLASYWVTGDTFILMCGESSPTNLRASLMSAQSAFYGMGQGISYGVAALLLLLLPKNINLGYFCLAMAVPCFIASLTLLMLKVKETKAMEITEKDREVDQEEAKVLPAEETKN
jgi:MFS family permease